MRIALIVLLLLISHIAKSQCEHLPNSNEEQPTITNSADVGGSESSGDGVWTVTLTGPLRALNTSLLGHYDLSGSLYNFDQYPSVASAMKTAGFQGSDWRVGLHRWEFASLLFKSLSDGSRCQFPGNFPKDFFVPDNTTDEELLRARDWFTYTDGSNVTMAMTYDDSRYYLGYIQKVLDVVKYYGANPYLCIDGMPRALANNKRPGRLTSYLADQCMCSAANNVSNTKPQDNQVFASALVGLVKRIFEGSPGFPPRSDIKYIEVWNEPEYPYFWVSKYGFDNELQNFFGMAIESVMQLDNYRKTSTNPAARNIKLGMAGFAQVTTATAVLSAFDNAPTHIPLDFISFHAYYNNPLLIIKDMVTLIIARDRTSNYKNTEVVLSEWGVDLAQAGTGWSPYNMDLPLHAATVISVGAMIGLSRAHRSLFFGYPDWALISITTAKKPTYYAYELLSQVIKDGSYAFRIAESSGGLLGSDNLGAVLCGYHPGMKQFDAIVINNDIISHQVSVNFLGLKYSKVVLYSDPNVGIVNVPNPPQIITIPPRAMILITITNVTGYNF